MSCADCGVLWRSLDHGRTWDHVTATINDDYFQKIWHVAVDSEGMRAAVVPRDRHCIENYMYWTSNLQAVKPSWSAFKVKDINNEDTNDETYRTDTSNSCNREAAISGVALHKYPTGPNQYRLMISKSMGYIWKRDLIVGQNMPVKPTVDASSKGLSKLDWTAITMSANGRYRIGVGGPYCGGSCTDTEHEIYYQNADDFPNGSPTEWRVASTGGAVKAWHDVSISSDGSVAAAAQRYWSTPGDSRYFHYGKVWISSDKGAWPLLRTV